MHTCRFASPLIVTLPHGATEIVDGPRAGIAVMARHGLGDYNMGRDGWRVAFHSLTNAVLDPTDENLARARSALEMLDALQHTQH